MKEHEKTGHRQRLRERFLAGEKTAHSEEALLELLLTYAIPQKDVQPLARQLLKTFDGLGGLLTATPEELCRSDGIKGNTAALLKLVQAIGTKLAQGTEAPRKEAPAQVAQADLFEAPAKADASAQSPAVATAVETHEVEPMSAKAKKRPPSVQPGRRTGSELFAKACLRDAIRLLPGLPDTDSLEEAKEYLRANLHYSAEQSRQRYTTYITLRMFPDGVVDKALRVFAKRFPTKKDLGAVCLYRFMKAEPLTARVIEDLLIPALGAGRLNRTRLRDYLKKRFPESRSIKDCGIALVEAMTSSGLVKADRLTLTFGYREISFPALAFVLHSEFPEPGMYDIAKIEGNEVVRSLLWDPNQIRPALYELRNLGILSKVSEIDTVRQFTTRYTLDEAVDRLAAAEGLR